MYVLVRTLFLHVCPCKGTILTCSYMMQAHPPDVELIPIPSEYSDVGPHITENSTAPGPSVGHTPGPSGDCIPLEESLYAVSGVQ